MLKKTSAIIGMVTVATAGALITSSPAYAESSLTAIKTSVASVTSTACARTNTGGLTWSDDHRRHHRRHHRHHGRMGAAIGS